MVSTLSIMPQPTLGAQQPPAPFRPVRPGSPLRRAIIAAYRRPEPEAVAEFSAQVTFSEDALARIRRRAKTLVERVRAERSRASGGDALMNGFALSSEEGIALMCLAEAVGVQPFGGERKSRTGPKAGRPLYLRALVCQSGPNGETARLTLPDRPGAAVRDLAAARSALDEARSELSRVDRAAVLAALSRHADATAARICA